MNGRKARLRTRRIKKPAYKGKFKLKRKTTRPARLRTKA